MHTCIWPCHRDVIILLRRFAPSNAVVSDVPAADHKRVQGNGFVPQHGSAMTSMMHIYGTAKKKRPGYLVGNLVATNWPIEKALHAIGYNQIPTK